VTELLAVLLFAISPFVWAWFEHFLFDLRDLHIGPPDLPIPEVQLVWEYHGPMAFIVFTLSALLSIIFTTWFCLLFFGIWLFVEDVAYTVMFYLWKRSKGLSKSDAWAAAVQADVFGIYIYYAWFIGLAYTGLVLFIL
jgi:hypothetical protein